MNERLRYLPSSKVLLISILLSELSIQYADRVVQTIAANWLQNASFQSISDGVCNGDVYAISPERFENTMIAVRNDLATLGVIQIEPEGFYLCTGSAIEAFATTQALVFKDNILFFGNADQNKEAVRHEISHVGQNNSMPVWLAEVIADDERLGAPDNAVSGSYLLYHKWWDFLTEGQNESQIFREAVQLAYKSETDRKDFTLFFRRLLESKDTLTNSEVKVLSESLSQWEDNIHGLTLKLLDENPDKWEVLLSNPHVHREFASEPVVTPRTKLVSRLFESFLALVLFLRWFRQSYKLK